jgi:glucose/arabinose dehydrogenase
MAFLADGRMLIVEKHRGIRIVERGAVGPLLPGVPTNVLRKEDSGFLDVALDPDYADNHTAYVAFVEGDEAANRTAVWRGQLASGRFINGRVIFRVNVSKKGTDHPGGRLLFLPDKTLLLTVGDGYEYKQEAQDLRSDLGKILRLTRDGKAPADNPFIGGGNAPEIWTLGHRNIQGLARDPATGLIWAAEHGPRGGDEINLLKAGMNYGWPLVSHGIDYDGTVITDRTFGPKIEPAKMVWMPSIAPSGLTVYRGSIYQDWDGKFLVGGLASRSLIRLRIGKDTGLLVEEDRMFAGLRARIRDVRTGPDGYLYLLTDDEDGMLMRVVPHPSH